MGEDIPHLLDLAQHCLCHRLVSTVVADTVHSSTMELSNIFLLTLYVLCWYNYCQLTWMRGLGLSEELFLAFTHGIHIFITEDSYEFWVRPCCTHLLVCYMRQWTAQDKMPSCSLWGVTTLMGYLCTRLYMDCYSSFSHIHRVCSSGCPYRFGFVLHKSIQLKVFEGGLGLCLLLEVFLPVCNNMHFDNHFHSSFDLMVHRWLKAMLVSFSEKYNFWQQFCQF